MQQPLAFTFPSPEDVAQQQRLMALLQSGAIQVSEPFPTPTAMFQPGVYSAGGLTATQLHPHMLEAFSHMRPEEQSTTLLAIQQAAAAQQAQAAQSQGQVPQFIPGGVNPAIMEQLLAQQQQQQAMANAVAVAAAGGIPAATGVIPTTPDGNILDVQRQYEALVLAMQKNPLIGAQNPQIPLAIERCQRILHEHHVQQQRMHEAMIQSSQQQHELHKHLLLGRVPAGGTPSETASTRGIRTGVIVHPN